MDTAPVIANGIAFGAFVLSAVAAIVAIAQAKIARDARLDAQDARRDARAASNAAAEHERKALAASERAAEAAGRSADEAKRSADALEVANDLTRAMQPRDVVVLEKISDSTGARTYAIRNISPDTLFAFGLVEVPADGAVIYTGELPYELDPDDVVTFMVRRTFGSKPKTTVVASWGDPTTAERTQKQFTIV